MAFRSGELRRPRIGVRRGGILLVTGEVAAPTQTVAPARPARAYVALIGGVMCIGFTAIFTKWAAVPGPAAAAIRMSIATVLLGVPFLWRLRHRRLPRAGILPAMLGGLFVGINLGFLNSALLLTSAATATLLDNMAPVWVGLGAMLLYKERLRARYWLGLAIALVGAAVVTGFQPGAVRTISQGDLLAFVGSVFYAGYLLITQRARQDIDALSCLWIAVATAAVSLTLACCALAHSSLGLQRTLLRIVVRRGPGLADRRLVVDQLCPGLSAGFHGRGDTARPAGRDGTAIDPVVGRKPGRATDSRGRTRAGRHLPVRQERGARGRRRPRRDKIAPAEFGRR